jgi:hypothetical protein
MSSSTHKTIEATLEDIRPVFDAYHAADESRIQAIIDHLCVGTDNWGDPVYREWDLPPVVVVQDDGNGHRVLDGHHRLSAAKRLGIESIPAWVVTVADYCQLIDDRFDGDCPSRLADLRDYIACGDVSANDVSEHGAEA